MNGLPDHVIRLFENWTNRVRKFQISGVCYSNGHCILPSQEQLGCRRGSKSVPGTGRPQHSDRLKTKNKFLRQEVATVGDRIPNPFRIIMVAQCLVFVQNDWTSK